MELPFWRRTGLVPVFTFLLLCDNTLLISGVFFEGELSLGAHVGWTSGPSDFFTLEEFVFGVKRIAVRKREESMQSWMK